jgi:hypothetical protein
MFILSRIRVFVLNSLRQAAYDYTRHVGRRKTAGVTTPASDADLEAGEVPAEAFAGGKAKRRASRGPY